jgi:dUTP pyrophosphatase
MSSEAVTLQVLVLREGARLPARQSEHASGFDLYACVGGQTLEVGTMPVLVPTGIAIAAPLGTDVQIRPRSGLSARGVMGTLGTIDADYRGELFVTLYCLPEAAPYRLEDGERIAQLVVSRLAAVEWSLVSELDSTSRGSSGHGSTGRT